MKECICKRPWFEQDLLTVEEALLGIMDTCPPFVLRYKRHQWMLLCAHCLYGCNKRVQPNACVRVKAKVTILLECSDSLPTDDSAGFIIRRC